MGKTLLRFRWLVSLGFLVTAGAVSHGLWLLPLLAPVVWDVYYHYARDRRYRYRPLRFTRFVFYVLFGGRRYFRYERLPRHLRASSYIPEPVRQAVFIRDKGQCQCDGCPKCTRGGWLARSCFYTGTMQYDHCIPRALGGSSTERNVRLMCPPCNRHKGDRLLPRFVRKRLHVA